MVHALFPGSFDPVTLGHVDLVERALAVFSGVTVAVAENTQKSALFTLDERVSLLRDTLPASDGLSVCTFSGLVVEFCKVRGCEVIVRGLRNGADFNYEYQMAQTNFRLDASVETLFLMASPEHSFLSSSLIKEIARNGGDVSAFVAPEVARRLNDRLGRAPR